MVSAKVFMTTSQSSSRRLAPLTALERKRRFLVAEDGSEKAVLVCHVLYVTGLWRAWKGRNGLLSAEGTTDGGSLSGGGRVKWNRCRRP